MAGVHPARSGQVMMNGGPLHNSYGREQSVTRGRNPTITTASGGLGVQPQPSLSARALSPRVGTPAGDFPSRPSTATNERERRGSGSYGHNRQTSIIQGVQHSRNNSQANSPGYNSRSPQVATPDQGGINSRSVFNYGTPINEQYGGYGSMSSTTTNTSFNTFHSSSSNSVPTPSSIVENAFASNDTGRREHNRSHSNKSEQKSVADYSLHHLFNSFMGRAEQKMSKCAKGIPEPFTRVEEICGPGVDADFDALISAMGHMNRKNPKPLVDTIMFWRKSKSEAHHTALQNLIDFRNGDPNFRSLSRRGTDQSTNESVMNSERPAVTEAKLIEEKTSQDRKLAIAIYFIMRILKEVYQQSNIEWIGENLNRKLQDLIFDQLSRLSLEEVQTSPFSHANWTMYGETLGVISTVHFSGIADRFIQKLQRLHEEVDRNSLPKDTKEAKDISAKLELLVKALAYVKLGTRTELQWRESCDFMYDLAQIFSSSHGQPLKHAYCQALELLVLPIAAASTQHLLAAPRWREFLNVLNGRLQQMMAKPRHWLEACPLSTMLLCASPSEQFSHQWQPTFTLISSKLKDRATRASALQSIARIVWTYLDRNRDKGVILRKLEDIIKIVLPSSKKQPISADPAFADPIIELARIIGYRFPEFCFRVMIFPLINVDLFNSGKDIKVEQLEPDRIVIGIRSFLAVLEDVENHERGAPPFPAFDLQDRIQDPLDLGVPHSPRPVAQPRFGAGSEGNFSKKVATNKLDQVTRDYYAKFCEVLGKITLICDNTFGGQATLEERLGGSTPKTPISESFSFGRRDEPLPPEVRQSYYDLLHVAIQALPRCFSNNIPFKPLTNLLCTGTAHLQQHIASSAATSLKAIARQSQAQAVTDEFAKFLFNYDGRYSFMSEDGLLGPGHIQRTLQLYVDLLSIWLDEIKSKTQNAGGMDSPSDNPQSTRGPTLDITHQTALVELTESYGFFFLCSSSRQIRSYGVNVLRLVTEFDSALSHQSRRIIQILEGDIYQVIQPDDDRLDVAERSRLEKGKAKKGQQITLIELCGGNDSYDSTLWFKVFPNVVRLSFDQCQIAVTLGREIISARLLHMHHTISGIAEPARSQQLGATERPPGRIGTTAQENYIEQWRLYLVMACTTLTSTGAQTQSQLQHVRSKSSKSPGGIERTDRILNARALFSFIIPLLSASSNSIRDAVVVALGSISTALYRTLLESLQYAVTSCNEDVRARANAHQRTGSAPRPDRGVDRLRTEVTHVYKLTSRFLKVDDVLHDEWIVKNLCMYTNSMRRFLSDAEIQNDWEFQTLRKHYCGLMEEVFEAVNRTPEPSRYLSFDDRKGAFGLMEDWCGFSPNQSQIAQREENMKQSALTQHNDISERLIEVQKKELRREALSAMASLCCGPLSVQVVSEGRVVQSLSFDVTRIMSWIDLVFATDVDKPHQVGRRALKNFIVHNQGYPRLMEHAIDMCFNLGRPKALESYFDVVSTVLTEHEEYPLHFWRVLVAILFNLGNEKGVIRSKAARLLKSFEQRLQRNSKLQDFDISISDKTAAVYKQAQFDISRRLAKSHSDQAFFVFSQFAWHYKNISPPSQRNMIYSILPWIQVIELQLEPNGSPTSQTYMFLANLLEITTRSNNSLHNEIQAFWQAVATGPHGGNVQVVLDFVISLCMDRREQSFVDYVKQIVVFLSGTPAGEKVVEYLLLQITPKNMVHTEKKPLEIPPDVLGLPYVADLGEALPIGNKQSGFSLGQLSLILLVDLMISPVKLDNDHVPLLLQVCLVYWDHYTPLVQEEAREMLVHLIHELVVSQIDDGATTTPNKRDIEDFVEAIRESKSSISWTYQESDSKDDQRGTRVPAAMTYVANQLIDIFSIAYPNIHESWAKTTLNWATSCSVRHVACRSFQIFRCMLQSLDKPMLSDMLARLSNTIADEAPEVQSFSMEILATLRAIVIALEAADLLKFPQLFWVTCACLNTVNEREFIETLELLDVLLAKVDLSDPAVVRLLTEAKPEKWEGAFEGIMPLVYKGLKSGNSISKTMTIINKTASLPNSNLIGDESRLLFGIFANLPNYLRIVDPTDTDKPDIESAEILATAAEADSQHNLARILRDFYHGRYDSKETFLPTILKAVEQEFFPAAELKSLVFLIGMLTNRLPWLIFNVIDTLLLLIPRVDLHAPDVRSLGPDLISPCLRLLQTQYCNHALPLMDKIAHLSSTPDDKQYLRMSMVSAESKNMRKEFDRTKSLYGIPEATGWSVPMPAINSNITRANVHAVFYTCASSAAEQAQAAATPEIEFANEEFHTDSYFTMDRNENSVLDDMGQLESFDGDLVSQLDSLDDYFNDNEDDDPEVDSKYLSGYSDVTITGYNYAADRAGASLYDQKTAPILENTLGRTPSTSSLQNPYTDSRPQTAMQGSSSRPGPTSFNTYHGNGTSAPEVTQQRPTLHSRSITSPSNPTPNNHPIPSSDVIPEPEALDDPVFSDDERSTMGRTATGGVNSGISSGNSAFEGAMRRTRSSAVKRSGAMGKSTTSSDGKEYGQRELLRGQGMSRLRSKSQAPGSPEVPKVPEAFLNLGSR